MENNTNSNNTQNQTEQGSTNTQPGGNGKQTDAGKLFTQEDVNRIVSERLKAERAKTGPSEQDAREIELSKRESKLSCRDFLDEKEYRPELLDILDTSDVENFKKTVTKLSELVPSISKKAVTVFKLEGGQPLVEGMNDAIADAFKPKI